MDKRKGMTIRPEFEDAIAEMERQIAPTTRPLSMENWTHDKKAGLIRGEGINGYVCRGFRKEHGDLIAAAPDLFSACKAALEYINSIPCFDDNFGDGIDESPLVTELRAAIAKARGREVSQ